MLETIYNLKKYLKVWFLWLPSSFLSVDIGSVSFHLIMFSVEQIYQKHKIV